MNLKGHHALLSCFELTYLAIKMENAKPFFCCQRGTREVLFFFLLIYLLAFFKCC